jgi:hypothetical protein
MSEPPLSQLWSAFLIWMLIVAASAVARRLGHASSVGLMRETLAQLRREFVRAAGPDRRPLARRVF